MTRILLTIRRDFSRPCRILLLVFCLLWTAPLITIAGTEDSLFNRWNTSDPSDPARIETALEISRQYQSRDRLDTAEIFASHALKLSIVLDNTPGKAKSKYHLGKIAIVRTNYVRALDWIMQSKSDYESLNDTLGISNCMLQTGVINYVEKNFDAALIAFQEASKGYRLMGDDNMNATAIYLSGLCHLEKGNYSIARNQLEEAAAQKKRLGKKQGYYESLTGLAEIHLRTAKLDSARMLFREGLTYYTTVDPNRDGEVLTLIGIGKSFKKESKSDSALFYLERAVTFSRQSKFYRGLLLASEPLAELYHSLHRDEEAFNMVKSFYTARDSIFNIENTRALEDYRGELAITKKQAEIDLLSKQRQIQRILNITLIAGVVVFLALSILLLKRFRFKLEANRKLENANSELSTTLSELRATQEQLIQSEKMASLGQLTAGIAHEIKNPLNFINNFSNVSIDLLQEAIDCKDPAEHAEILQLLQTNLEKIEQHGKRANGIVNSMMMHARQGELERQPIDLRELIQDALQLSYHSMRALKQDFVCEIEKEFSASLQPVKIVRQDISRVLLNLFSNAFYAVYEKARKQLPDYRPRLTVRLLESSGKPEIRIVDNGPGIPSSLLNRVFDPFFTTKPAGEGTGLGLSISHDIMKSHGGTLTVVSEEGISTEFILTFSSPS